MLKPESPEDSSLVVFGAGAVGMAAVFAAVAIKMQKIIVVDLVDDRLALAKSLGATNTINGRDPGKSVSIRSSIDADLKLADILKKITDLTGGGSDYAIEATGAAPCIKTAWAGLAPCGKMVQLGTPGPGPTADLGIHDAVCLSKSYMALCEGDSNPPEYVPKLVQMHKDGKFPIEKISKVYDYKNFDDAVHAMHSGEIIKPIIRFK